MRFEEMGDSDEDDILSTKEVPIKITVTIPDYVWLNKPN